MKAHRLFWLTAALLAVALLPPGRPAAALSFPQAEVAATVGSPVRINEVLPRPAAGGHDWVELSYPESGFRLYLPLVLQGVQPSAAARAVGGDAGGALLPAFDISGWQISDQDGQSYTIPAALPPLPPGAFVLIHFDGLGPAADDYDLADGLAVLHTPAGLADIFDDAADQVALYTASQHSPATLQDFVAYGAPPAEDANDAVAAGLWTPGAFVSLALGSGAQEAGEVLPSRSLGLYPGHTNTGAEDWAIYQGEDISPGRPNPVPRAVWGTVGDGVTMSRDGFAVGWALTPGATYQLQMDDDPGFGSPVVNVTLDEPRYAPQAAPPVGSYWWRVRASLGPGNVSAWSAALRITVIAGATEAQGAGLAAADNVVLPITWLRQRKDTRLLCLDGDSEGNPASAASEEAWDAVHPDGIFVHGQNNCVRASIAMIVTNYGGNLSQDRLSYHLFENYGAPVENAGNVGNPHMDLGHDHTTLVCGGDGSNGGTLLAWALGINKADYTYGHIDVNAKPSFAQIRNWIDAGRPIMRFWSGHQTVIGGYRTLGDGTQQIRLFDPWSAATWQTYSGVDIRCWYVPPAAAPGVRSDEPGIWTDSDGDGIMDWDEQVRFHTDPTWPDTDEDWVQDKQDIREYVFNNAGNYNLRAADLDGDTLRKELDSDNDGDGAVDGCEDANYNGHYEPGLGESNNFDAASHHACAPQFEILVPTQSDPTNAGAYNSPDKILVQVKTATPPTSPVTYTAGDFRAWIGGLEANVIAAYAVLDGHMLVVAPQAVPTADYYDLQVTLLGSYSDTETRAVFFLPKLRTDQVLVVDRSGSMTDYGKMDAAKNAARAFIDHANVDDMIGVVSYASSAGPAADYPLTTVTGDPILDAAKAAVNGLTASGATALGQGVRLGYDELVARGKADHDWALALLSDGLENVAPYWSDPTVSGVIAPSRAVVHTVALGRDADRILMTAIAGATGGTPYEAGVDTLPLAAAAFAPAAPEAGAKAEAVPGPSLAETLPNRLADVYKAIGERIGHQQRVWEQTGIISTRVTFELPVEKGLPEAIFAVNWPDPKIPVIMTLIDPKGDTVKPGYAGMSFRDDPTHQQYRIRNPLAGTWVVDLRTREQKTEYLFILSARSSTSMHLGFGLPPLQRLMGVPLPILVVLADNRPIVDAEVWVWVQGPNSDLVQMLQLFDDGAHGDGRAGDGVYGNLFTRTLQAGPYVVKATGWGKNNAGESFVRYRTGGFTILPRVAYIWRSDLTTAVSYRTLLQGNGFAVDLIHVNDVPKTPWAHYNLALIGPETGDGAEWGTPAALNTLLQYPIPIIGLGEGGYAFFGKAGLAIGHPYGWHGQQGRTYVVDTEHAVWHSPYAIPFGRDRIVTAYKRTDHVGIQVVRPPADMLLIGREPDDQTHYNLLQQRDRFLLWGFQAGPGAMSTDGQHLFVNIARYMVGM